MRHAGMASCYWPCLLVFDRQLQCCLARWRRSGRKGIAKLCRVPTAGCHKQSDLKCTGCKPSIAGWATTESMVRQRIVRRKPLYLVTTSQRPDGVERIADRTGWTLYFLLVDTDIRNVSGDRLLLLSCLPVPPGVEHGTYGLKG